MAFARRKSAKAGKTSTPAKPGVATEASPRVVNKDVRHAFTKAATNSWSGSLEIVDRTHGCLARVYFHEGGVYSVQVDGYRANIAARLVTAGVITAVQADHARTVEATTTWLVENGLVDVDSIGALHQEYLLATLAAVMELPKVKIKMHKGATTSALCTMPLSVEALSETLDLRHSRYMGTSEMLSPEGNPGTLVLEDAGAERPSDVNIPEIRVFRDKVAPGRTIDDIAGASGLTRAEAVHLAWMLVSAGVVSVLGHGTGGVDPHQWTVPEQFGSRALEAAPELKPVVAAAPTPAPAQPAAPTVAPMPTPVPAAVAHDGESIFDEQVIMSESVEQPVVARVGAPVAPSSRADAPADVPAADTSPAPVAAPAPAPEAAPAPAPEAAATATVAAEMATAPVVSEFALSSPDQVPLVAALVGDLKRDLVNAQQAQQTATALVVQLNSRLERLEASLMQHAS